MLVLLDDGRYALPAAPISDADAGTLGLYSGWFATKLRPGCGLHSSDHPYGESLWGIPIAAAVGSHVATRTRWRTAAIIPMGSLYCSCRL